MIGCVSIYHCQCVGRYQTLNNACTKQTWQSRAIQVSMYMNSTCNQVPYHPLTCSTCYYRVQGKVQDLVVLVQVKLQGSFLFGMNTLRHQAQLLQAHNNAHATQHTYSDRESGRAWNCFNMYVLTYLTQLKMVPVIVFVSVLLAHFFVTHLNCQMTKLTGYLM